MRLPANRLTNLPHIGHAATHIFKPGFIRLIIGNHHDFRLAFGAFTDAFGKLALWRFDTAQGLHVVLPATVLVLAGAAVLTWWLLNRTLIGRAVYAIGGSLAIAERLGYNLRTVHIFVFAYAGFLSGLAGIVHVSSTRLANPFDLVGNELDVIAAVILGGARITGGSGTVGGTLLGVVLVTLINNVLILAGVPGTWQKVIIGAFILVAGACFAMRKQG